MKQENILSLDNFFFKLFVLLGLQMIFIFVLIVNFFFLQLSFFLIKFFIKLLSVVLEKFISDCIWNELQIGQVGFGFCDLLDLSSFWVVKGVRKIFFVWLYWFLRILNVFKIQRLVIMVLVVVMVGIILFVICLMLNFDFWLMLKSVD